MPEQFSLQQVAVTVGVAAIVLLAPSAAAQPFQPGTGFAPLGKCIPACKSPPVTRLALGAVLCSCIVDSWGASQAFDASVTCVFYSLIVHLPIRRSGALQQTLYGSLPACPVVEFLHHVNKSPANCRSPLTLATH